MIRTGLAKFGFFGTALAASVGMPLIMASSAFAQEASPTPTLEAVAYNENGTVIDRREIDETGRRATGGVLIADPSVRAVGH